MSFVQSTPRPAAHRADRGIVTVIEGGASETNAGQARLELLPGAESPDPSALTPHNYQTALGLLEYAARALEILYDRRDELEASLERVSKRAEGEVTAAQAKVLDWQKLAAALKNQVQELERQLGSVRQRAELAEMQIAGERARADAAERKASDAIVLSQGFHSKIVGALGRGSSAYKALLVAVDEPQRA